jgi:hypothetical protein
MEIIEEEKKEEQRRMYERRVLTTSCPKCEGDGCRNCNGTGEVQVMVEN